MRPEKNPWSDDEIVMLLAYLEYYAKTKTNFNWSTSSTLRKLTAHIESRFLNQVERKLLELSGGSKETLEVAVKYGILYLTNIPDRLRQQIQNTLVVIEISEVSQTLGTPRSLRSGKTRSVSIETQTRTPRHSSFGTQTPTKRSSNVSRNTITQRTLPLFESLIRDNVKVENPSVCGSRSPGSRAPARVDLDATSDHPRYEIADSFENCPDAESVVFAECHYGKETETTQGRLFGLRDVQDVPAVNYERINETSIFQTSDVLEVQEMLRDLLSDNHHFRQRCLLLEQELEDFRREKRSKASLERLSHEHSGWSESSTIQSKDKLIADLNRRLTNQRFLQPFLQLSADQRPLLDLKKIERSYCHIKDAIYCLAGMKESECTIPMEFDSEGLGALLERSLGRDSQLLSCRAEKSRSASSHSSSLMMQSLTGAAVCEWVFLPDMRCAALLSTPLLESYRYHLKSLCREHGLLNFDIAAHRRIEQDEDFRKIYISQTATRLAKSLYAALEQISAGGIKPEQEEAMKKELMSVFYHALIVKFEVMLCKDKFDIIWPTPNTIFDGDLMEKHAFSSPGTATDSLKNAIEKVELAIVPGIQCYKGDRNLISESAFFKAGEERIGVPARVLTALVSIR